MSIQVVPVQVSTGAELNYSLKSFLFTMAVGAAHKKGTCCRSPSALTGAPVTKLESPNLISALLFDIQMQLSKLPTYYCDTSGEQLV